MAQRLLSIDIRADVVAGLILQKSGRTTRLVCCASAQIGEKGEAAALREILLHLDGWRTLPCRVSLAAENFSFRNLTLPFSDKRKIEKILPVELEESLAVDLDGQVADSLVVGKKSGASPVIAALAGKEFIAGQLAMLAEFGIDPEIVTIGGVQAAIRIARFSPEKDFILLDCSSRSVTLFVVLDGQLRLVRSILFDDGAKANFAIDANTCFVSAKRPTLVGETLEGLAREVRRTLYALDDAAPDIPFFLTGPLAGIPNICAELERVLGNSVKPCTLDRDDPTLQIDSGLWRADLMNSALALGLRNSGKAGFNFRKGEFVRKASADCYKTVVKRVAIPLLVFLGVAVGLLWRDYAARNARYQELASRCEKLFAETLPEVKRVQNLTPATQFTSYMKELKRGTLSDVPMEGVRVLDLLAEISGRIPGSTNVRLLRLVADSNSLLLRGVTDTFNSVDAVKKVLEQSPMFSGVDIASANLDKDGKNVRFELKLLLKTE